MKAWVAKEQPRKVAIVAGIRTPFAKAGTKLKDCSAVHLGVRAATEALAQIDLAPEKVDEVVFGNAGTPANAANISRVIALRAGFPQSISAYTVHRNCASAMEAIAQGCVKIGAGLAETMLVGGTESMSNMPLLFNEEMKGFFTELSMAKTPMDKVQSFSHFRPQMLKPVIAIIEGLTDPISGMNMGQTAELLARDFMITREEQDNFALKSHQKAAAAMRSGRFERESTPVFLEPDYKEFLTADIGPRENQSLEALAKLKPFFDRENGTVTPGNACPITDGASALVLMDLEKAKAEGYTILATIDAFSFTGCDPKRMGMGPIFSTSKVLAATQTDLKNVDLVELNEAFAAQVIANQKAFASKKYCSEVLGRSEALGELSEDKLNVNGGAVALGHPVGTTGARLVLTLVQELKESKKNTGLATLCIGGGQGAAFLVRAA